MEGTTAVTTSTAPATSGASSGETSRPATMAEAFARNPVDASASPADTTASTDQTTEQPAEATPPPVPVQAKPDTPAPLPFEAHKRILDNAYKERDDARSRLTALESQLNSPEGQRLRQWAQSFQQNPEQWIASTLTDLVATRPDLAPALRSQAARILGSRQQPAAEPANFDPDIPVYDERGQMVAQTFSAEKVKALLAQERQALTKELDPIKSEFQQRKQQEHFAAVQKEATDTAARQFDAAKQWPGFLTDPAKGTVDPDLVKAFNEHPDWDLREAYINVVVPKLGARKEAEVLDSLKTKAAAATGVNPSGAVIASTKRPKSLTDPSLKWS